MCEYCETEKETNNRYLYMSDLPILDDYNERLITGFHRQYQYIRKSTNSYNLITETNNEDGDVLNLPINYCPMCGRKLGEEDKQ